ncbi:hypothetical protein [Natrarchaeobaculum aegyptiacum]|nr:hypothetical protein [Natrarchaeobaculum aegyptiacum]
MSDRSDELTESREPRSTDDLLEETDRLLSDSGGGGSSGPSESASDVDSSPFEESDTHRSASVDDLETNVGTERADGSATSVGSRLGRIAPSVSTGDLFSPKAFLAFMLLLGSGLLVGNAVIPFAGLGGLVGAFGMAFLAGLVTSKRRYLEVITGGASAGGITGLLTTDLTFAIAVSFSAPLLVGAGVGLLASVVGYYFGRDLRDGLSRDID